MGRLVKSKSFNKEDVIYIGSSIHHFIAPQDTDKRTIGTRINDYLPDISVKGFSMSGWHLEMFNPFIRYLSSQIKLSDKLLIVEVSLHQFPYYFNKRPSFQFKKEQFELKNNIVSSWYMPLSIFNFSFNIPSQFEYDNYKVYYEDRLIGSLGEIRSEISSKNENTPELGYILAYWGKIEENNEKLESLKNLIRFQKGNDLSILYVIPPLNFEYAYNFFGKNEVDRQFSKNLSIITDVFEKENVSYLNLWNKLPSHEFSHPPKLPNGHMRSNGKSIVSKEISEWIESNEKELFKPRLRRNKKKIKEKRKIITDKKI